MKTTKEAKKFIEKSNLKKLLNSGGRRGAKKDFFEVLKRAIQPVKS